MTATAYIKSYNVHKSNLVTVSAVVVGHDATSDEVFNSLSKATKHQLIPVRGTVRMVSKSADDLQCMVTAVMDRTRDIRPYTENHGFRSLSKNQFLDDAENIWTLSQAGDGKVFVRANELESVDDMANLMKACCSNSGATTTEQRAMISQSSNNGVGVQGGDYAQFISASGDVRFGYVAAELVTESGEDEGLLMVSSTDGESETINREDIIVSVPADQFTAEVPEYALDSKSSAGDAEVLINYWRRVLSYRPDFFAQLEARIRSYAFC